MAKFQFTEKALEKVVCPPSGRSERDGRVWSYDLQTRGLAYMVTETGGRSFYYFRRVPGKAFTKRAKLDQTTLVEARREVDRLNGLRSAGAEPVTKREALAADQSGGELLLGQGDMLMLKPTGAGLCRAQGAFVDDKEIKNVCKFLKEIAEPEFHPELMQLGASEGLAEGEEKDPLYNEAVDIMVETGRGSVSLIQRRLNIGYSRASRLIDQMRRTGIVGAYKGSMASEVVITKEQWEQMKAENAGKRPLGGDGTDGSTGGRNGTGGNAGFAQQVNTTFDEAEEDGVPDEMPGEHRL